MFDSSYKKVADVYAKNGYQGDLHEFVVTPQGTALFTCYGQAHADLSRYGGTRQGTYFYGVVQEVDLSTGKLVFEWRSDDHIGLDESYKPAQPNSAWDYFHHKFGRHRPGGRQPHNFRPQHLGFLQGPAPQRKGALAPRGQSRPPSN